MSHFPKQHQRLWAQLLFTVTSLSRFQSQLNGRPSKPTSAHKPGSNLNKLLINPDAQPSLRLVTPEQSLEFFSLVI